MDHLPRTSSWMWKRMSELSVMPAMEKSKYNISSIFTLNCYWQFRHVMMSLSPEQDMSGNRARHPWDKCYLFVFYITSFGFCLPMTGWSRGSGVMKVDNCFRHSLLYLLNFVFMQVVPLLVFICAHIYIYNHITMYLESKLI